MRKTAWVLVLGTACGGGGLGAPSSGSAGNGSCVPGLRACPCYPNQTCDGALTCASDVCVDLGGGGASGGASAAAGTTASGGASGNGPTATGGTIVATGGRSTGGRSTGGTSTGGSAPTGGTSVGQPACGTTSTGTSIAKGVACASGDPQLCYKTCGPINVGFKSETCTGGAYAEGDCAFSMGPSYACFQVPATDAAGCPTTLPQHNQPCGVGLCSVPCSGPCDVCGVSTGYADSSGVAKAGYCVCITDATVGSKWSCASTNAWPCPGGQGC